MMEIDVAFNMRRIIILVVKSRCLLTESYNSLLNLFAD